MSLKAQMKEALERLNAKRDGLAEIFAQAGPEMDMDKVTCLDGDRTAKVEAIRTANAEIDDLKAKFEELRDIERAAANAAEAGEAGADEPEPGKPGAVKSLGQLFVESAAYRDRTGSVGPQATLDVDVRNTLFETGAGWAPESTRTGIVTLSPQRPAPHVVDFIPVIPTTQTSVKYMEETTFTNNAVEKAEGTTFGEAALVLTERTQTVEKIPVWLPMTDEQLEDEPMARAYVEQRLVFMLRQRIDLQVLQGTGVSPLLLGTESVSGIQVQAKGGDSVPDAIYKGFTKIRDDGFAEPSVVFIRPSKWQDVRLLKEVGGQYIWGHPALPGPETIWGVPVVQTTAAPATKAITGDYVTHSFLAPKRGIDVQVTNSHSTDFINGKQAIRADVRLAMVHLRPKAFAEITGL